MDSAVKVEPTVMSRETLTMLWAADELNGDRHLKISKLL